MYIKLLHSTRFHWRRRTCISAIGLPDDIHDIITRGFPLVEFENSEWNITTQTTTENMLPPPVYGWRYICDGEEEFQYRN